MAGLTEEAAAAAVEVAAAAAVAAVGGAVATQGVQFVELADCCCWRKAEYLC